jgi:hypothetical protein
VHRICKGIPAIRTIRRAIDKRINPNTRREKRAFSIVASFHANYKKGAGDECWIWEGLRHPVSGYGIQQAGDKTVFKGVGRQAHRRAWYLSNGTKPPRGMSKNIMHTCDNPSCVNPAHLVLGTPKMNHDDAVKRAGKRMGRKKLSDQDVINIRSRYAGPSSCVALANEYGISSIHVYNVAMGYRRENV